ncbi:hypothetical protein EBB07_26180 [Paenibacillaceae bacterium]|nr:hypothetical protein EBB07_26180 [Paenibacillaceae bacterium]
MNELMQWCSILFLLAVLLIVLQRQRKYRTAAEVQSLLHRDAATSGGRLSKSDELLQRPILYFTRLSDSELLVNVNKAVERFPAAPIIVIYEAPEWRANAIMKQLPEQARVWVDKDSHLTGRFGLKEVPSFLIDGEEVTVKLLAGDNDSNPNDEKGSA